MAGYLHMGFSKGGATKRMYHWKTSVDAVAADIASSLFITGTDTGVGKTWATLALMEKFKSRGKTVAGMKPVASGGKKRKLALTNEDALAIQKHASVITPYAGINPYVFAPPIAPHIAAARVNVKIDPAVLVAAYAKLASANDCVVVEGVGGWRVPLSREYSTVELVRDLGLPVVLVVGLRLGCINHALLTHECMRNDGIELAGWLANCIDPDYGEVDETLHFLSDSITAPLLGVFPYQDRQDVSKLADRINIAPLCK